jgi:hypothetical protein
MDGWQKPGTRKAEDKVLWRGNQVTDIMDIVSTLEMRQYVDCMTGR